MKPSEVLDTIRNHPRVILALVVVLLVVFGPRVAWRLAPDETLDVVIVDKTVPFERYREHAVVPWLLRATKMRSRGGTYLRAEHDYVGFDPRTKQGRDLRPEDLASADVLFLADTYGVYEGDYEGERGHVAIDRSPKIYGGLTDDEAAAIEAFASHGGLVIAEFNTFASPTGAVARERMERLFGVRWTRWVARYWPDLSDANDVPKWLGEVHERVHGAPLERSGGALVFVRDAEDIVVLRDGEDLVSGDPVTQERTAAGAVLDLPKHGRFASWMDVVEAEGAEVLHEHVVAVTTTGRSKLEGRGLRERFPAVMRRRDAYYFAGDFVDNAADLGDPERLGLLSWRSAMTAFGASLSDDRSFWSFYVPILTRLLSSRAH